MDAVEGSADGAWQVAVATSCEADVVAIEVRDTGQAGIPADHLPKIFELFFHDEGAGRRPRPGGFALDRRSARRADPAEDLAGRGATFRLALPSPAAE